MLKKIIKNIRILELASAKKTNAVFTGNYQSAFKGRGVEFADIREYDDHDSYRDIDWITSAKQNKLYVKNYHETRELMTTVLVDCSSSMHFASGEKSKAVLALETLAVLGFSALKSNDSFGVIFFSDEILEWIPPKKGRSHLIRILNRAVHHLSKKYYQKSDIEKTLFFVQSMMKRKSLFFLLTDEISYPLKTKKYLSVMSKKYDFVPIVLFDPLEKEWTEKGVFYFQDAESNQTIVADFSSEKNIENYNRERNIKWKKCAHFFQKNQMDFLPIGVHEDLYKKLFLFFKKRQTRF